MNPDDPMPLCPKCGGSLVPHPTHDTVLYHPEDENPCGYEYDWVTARNKIENGM